MSQQRKHAPKTAHNVESEQWLSIDAACKRLGIDQSTLRRWSDSGRIPVFRTPGGHRRYRETDLTAFVQGSQPTRMVSRKNLTRLSISAYEPDYLKLARERRWYHAYSEDQLHELRILGRQLIDFAVRSISDQSSEDIAEIFEEGRRIGRRYGAVSAEAGLSATDAVEAFLFFRYPVFQSVTRFFEEEHMPANRAIKAFTDICRFMDEVLVATMTAHADAEIDR